MLALVNTQVIPEHKTWLFLTNHDAIDILKISRFKQVKCESDVQFRSLDDQSIFYCFCEKVLFWIMHKFKLRNSFTQIEFIYPNFNSFLHSIVAEVDSWQIKEEKGERGLL